MSNQDLMPPASPVPDLLLAIPTPDMTPPEKLLSKPMLLIRFIVFDVSGLVMLYVALCGGEKSIILFDHGVTNLVNQQHALSVILLFMLIIFGVIKTFNDGSWRKNITQKIRSGFKVLGL